MIAKLIKGKGFRGALDYALRKDKGYLLDSNMAGKTPRTLANEFGNIRALRPGLGKAVCHVAISLPPNESLSDEQWKEVTHLYLDHMKFNDSQYVAVRHTDTDHQHIHIIANRISSNGSVVSDSNDYKRQEVIMRKLEKSLGLTQIKESSKTMRKAPTKGEIEHSVRTGAPSSRQILQQAIDNTLNRTNQLDDFVDQLEQRDIETILNTTSTGRIYGVSFQYNDITMKGSSLGNGYSWNALQERGLTCEQDRSNEKTISRGKANEEELGSKDRITPDGNDRERLFESAKLQRDYDAFEASKGNNRKSRDQGRELCLEIPGFTR